jgi:predicted metal-dependent phosphoesterase TrpH
MNEFRADLHCHSFCSDGSDSPEALLKKAKEIGLGGLSITDHDSIEAYTPELFRVAEMLEVRLLTGVELSSEWEGASVHILGYAIDIESIALKDFLAEMIRRRGTRNSAIIEKLKARKIAIEMEEVEALAHELAASRTIGRPHIAAVLVQKGIVNSVQEAFELYLQEGASCYVSGLKYTPKDAIEIIHEAKGKAVLAHPHFIKKGAHLRCFMSLPFDGIECYYGTLPSFQVKPWVEKAKQKGLIATGGSDYHGHFKPHISLGCSWVGADVFNLLLTRDPNR